MSKVQMPTVQAETLKRQIFMKFDKSQLFYLIYNKKFGDASDFLNNKCCRATNKVVAVNFKDDRNVSTLMMAAWCRAPLNLIKQLCKMGGKNLIMHQSNYGSTALHYTTCSAADPDLEVVKFLVERGGYELLMLQNK